MALIRLALPLAGLLLGPAHHGGIFIYVEAALGVGLAILLFRRFRAVWVRSLLALAIAAYIAVPLYFTLALGDGT